MRRLKALLSFVSIFKWRIFGIIYFNFKFLPYSQAVKLPIWIISRNSVDVYKKGIYIIESDNIYPGMIKLGLKQRFYYDKGLSINNDGIIRFRGSCVVGNESVIRVSKDAEIVFGDNFGASSSTFLCNKSITFGKNVLVGINCMIMDSDFHPILDMYANKCLKLSIPVVIGDNNWLGYDTLVLKGTKTPNDIIIGARSILNKKYKVSEFSILGNNTSAELIAEGYKLFQ